MSLSGVWSTDKRRLIEYSSYLLQVSADRPNDAIVIDDVILSTSASGVLYRSNVRVPLAVAFDGVIFDRSSLLSKLELEESPACNDAHLLASAYEQWGEGFPAHLDGEFAFVLWDCRSRQLILGRDVVGKGGLFYTTCSGTTAFSTDLHGLFSIPGITARTDDESVVRFLTMRPQLGRTLFRDVFYPPPAQVVVKQQDRADRFITVWQPEQQPLLHLRAPQDYAEALHAALLRAVEIRVPEDGLVASQLSSGYDSSGVTALLAQVLARQNRSLLAYTSVPTHSSDASTVLPGWFSDEWPLAHQVAEMYQNIEHIRIGTGDKPWMLALDDLTQIYSGQLFFIRNASWMLHLQRDAQARGATVMFNGQMGNLTSSYDGVNSLFDLRRRHDWMGLAKAIRWRRRRGASWRGLLARTWMPSASTRSAIRSFMGKPQKQFYEYSMIRPEFVRSTGLSQPSVSPLGSPIEGDRRNSAARRLSIMRMVDFGGVAAGEHRLFGLRRADPTSDRGVIELCLSIPDEAYLMGNQPRDLYRHAMRNVLPPELLRQTRGGLQSSDFLENFRERIDEFRDEMVLLNRSPAAQRVLDVPRMQQILDAFPANLHENRAEADQRYNYTFGGALALGRFLRRLEEGTIFPIH